MSLLLFFALALIQDGANGPPRDSPSQRPRAVGTVSIDRYYPDRARRLELDGRALLTCKLNSEGLMEACIVAEQRPLDAGFGDAALRMVRDLPLRPGAGSVRSSDGDKVHVPFGFRLEGFGVAGLLTMDEALTCYGFRALQVGPLGLSGPVIERDAFAREVTWQAYQTWETDRQVKDRLSAARKAAVPGAPMPPKCALPEGAY